MPKKQSVRPSSKKNVSYTKAYGKTKKRSSTSSLSRLSTLLSFRRLSRLKFAAALLVFAAVGSYFVFFSKAATVSLASLEAEAMTQPAGSGITPDSTASAGQALSLYSNGTATGSFSIPSAADKITIRAKGSQCRGAPSMVVKVDGTQVQIASVSATSWTEYTAAVNIPVGQHIISLSFTNDYARKNCDRNLSIDNISIYGTVPDSQPSAQFTLSPSPASVAPGGQLKVSWTAPAGQTSEKDWIGIYSPTDANEEWEKNNNWQYTNGALSGTMTFTAPTTAGTYEFRYLLNDGFTSTAKSTAITVSQTATPTPTPAPAPAPAPSTTCARGTKATWQPVNAPILSDAEATACVRRSAWEPRPGNSTPNNTVPTASQVQYFNSQPDNYLARGQFTGNFKGTTDEIVQWVSYKWGLDEDIVRAVGVAESWWNQVSNGCHTQGGGFTNPTWSQNPGSCPMGMQSTAANLEIFAAYMRQYYDNYQGHAGWLNDPCCFSGYRYPDQGTFPTAAENRLWGSIGAWYAGRWFNGDPSKGKDDGGAALWYIREIQGHLNNKTWAQPGF